MAAIMHKICVNSHMYHNLIHSLFCILTLLPEAINRRWSPAAPVVVIVGMKNKDAASDHETATIISSFSEWLLWGVVFINIAIDIDPNITTGIGAVIAINIGTVIKIWVNKVKCNMANKVCTKHKFPLIDLSLSCCFKYNNRYFYSHN